MNTLTKRTALLCAITVGMAGCATDDLNQRAKVGAAVGGGRCSPRPSTRRQVRSFLSGCGRRTGRRRVGHYMDNQQKDFESQMQRRRDAISSRSSACATIR